MSGKPKLGLVLGSGGLRGLAHVGVLSVLEENGIEVDLVAGCSIGSLIGALICAGYDSDTIMKLANGLGRGSWLQFVVHKKGFIGTENIYKIVTMLTKGRKIEELGKPFAAVATDLATGREHVFRDGNSAAAVCASVAVPGIFVPYEWDGRQLVDGAIVNPTPVSVAREMGYQEAQAWFQHVVKLTPTLHHISFLLWHDFETFETQKDHANGENNQKVKHGFSLYKPTKWNV